MLGCQLIVSHHPLLFHGLKQICGQSAQACAVEQAVRHGIAVYSAHTSLDCVPGGINTRLADMLGIPLKTVEHVDSSLGSAMLAGVAVGLFAGHEDAVRRCVRETGVTMPDPEGAAFYDSRFPVYKQIQAALAPIYHQL
jgi:putative NIF3 family GTP cyclohydrolase 1 type 2